MTRCWGWRPPPNPLIVTLWASPWDWVVFCVFSMGCYYCVFVKNEGKAVAGPQTMNPTPQAPWPPLTTWPRHSLKRLICHIEAKTFPLCPLEVNGLSSWPRSLRIVRLLTSIALFNHHRGKIRKPFWKLNSKLVYFTGEHLLRMFKFLAPILTWLDLPQVYPRQRL